ncbi:hypothetical protein T265_08265 [Opisthorchis viverrini]|uniref:Reverse transcriptase domain-containing protein n=1 Tax=Opisthorchis viverrini TaxID=6198 RepID=A0A075A8X6_OPIVI|nr:hypothetical protein T265_08265 [Opisthorchis viverrini]KER23969.1 hypothetical protein T265_08265 [Opisthorchis viverrini]
MEGLQTPGVQMACDEKLVDLEYADDIVLIFGENAQVFLDELIKVIPLVSSFGMHFTPTKCKVMFGDVRSLNTPLTIQGEVLEVVERFTCLGSCISSDCSVTDEQTHPDSADSLRVKHHFGTHTYILEAALSRKVACLWTSIPRTAVTPFWWCLAAMSPEGSTRAGILSGCPSLDRGIREAEVGFEPRTCRSVNSRSDHLGHLASEQLANSGLVFQKETECAAPGRLMIQLIRYLRYHDRLWDDQVEHKVDGNPGTVPT